MRISSSQHVHYLNSHANHSDTTSRQPLRAPVDVNQLSLLVKNQLNETIDNNSSMSMSKQNGKQRHVIPDKPAENPFSRKDRNSSLDSMNHSGGDAPLLREVPVFQHTFEIQLSNPSRRQDTRKSNSTRVKKDGEYDDLVKLLEERGFGVAESGVKDLGRVSLEIYEERIAAFPFRLTDPEEISMDVDESDDAPRKPLFDLPRLCTPGGEELISAANILASNGRATLSASLQVISHSASLADEEESQPDLQLNVIVSVGLVTPTIFGPFSSPTRKHDAAFAQRTFLSHILPPPPTPASYNGQTNIPFLFTVLGPAPNVRVENAVQPKELRPTLLPFQRRSVGWLLEREGKKIDDAGNVVPIPATDIAMPLFWERVSLPGLESCYFNRLNGFLLPSPPPNDDIRGGILAEEPGLGKTLESIALILLNPAVARSPKNKRWDAETRVDVKEVKTTLIVTPASLATQWADELALHSPTLKVLIYEGWQKIRVPLTEATAKEAAAKSMKRKAAGKRQVSNKRRNIGAGITRGRVQRIRYVDEDDDEDDELDGYDEYDDVLDWCSYVNQFDVCITTYNILQQDLGVARAPVIRPRREVASYQHVEKPRSPLIMCEWYRVIMDEVQMVGGGKTEEMVSLIPRLSSFAVSGTPARASVADLVHVLKFLRVGAVVDTPKIWARLQEPAFAHEFASLFSRLAIRTLKSGVQDELTIPTQRRFVVPIDLGRVEQHVYDQNLEQALLEIGLDARGVAATEGWEVDVTVLRTWIRKLRGICTHPQVGQLFKPNDKLLKAGTLKTIGEVLEGMKDQNWRNLMDGRKSKIVTMIRRAQLMQHDKADVYRHRHVLELLLAARTAVKDLEQTLKDVIAEHDAKGEVLKQEAANRKQGGTPASSVEPPEADNGKGKGKEREASVALSEDDSMFDDGLPKTPAGEEHSMKRRALQARLREVLVVEHQVQFLLGDVYHTLGADYSAVEDDSYNSAETVRRALLKTTEDIAEKSMSQLQRTAAKKSVTLKELHISHCGKGGIKSDHLLREADEIIDVLNEQTDLLWQWRARIFELLTAKLSAGEDGKADGEEYARTLETQGEAETYLQAYSAVMADRREVMVAERTALAAHDVRERKLRHTKAAKKAAMALENPEVFMQMQIELQPEDEVLKNDLMKTRKDILKGYKGRAIKSVMVDLSSVVSHITKDTDPEKIIAKEWATTLRRLIQVQGILMDKLESDMVQFRKAFNDRIQYFRQLQEISDSVTDATWEGSVKAAIEGCKLEETSLEADINKNRARQRYLEHMAQTQQDGEEDEDEGVCIMCRCDFVRGFITQCAHVYCEDCMKAWLQKKEGKTCPVCRVIINVDQMQRISMREKEVEKALPPTVNGCEPAPRSRRIVQYNTIDPRLFEEIQNVESVGSYGTKIQTLVRHLLFLQDNDPGAKSIVFSAWADSLHIIEHALVANGIPCLRIDQKRGKQNAANVFKNSPEILVLLLHGERENAGLNVTSASRVFLVESVVQHNFEIQAIARIDRMGQTRPTEVYCYYAEDTVEKNILDLAARQGSSLYTKERASGTLHVSSLGSQDTKIDGPSKKAKQKGDFIMRSDDMLAVLFPHMFEDIEYLLDEDSQGMDMDGGDDWNGPYSRQERTEQPVAGPSRLR